jgi:hypothetical protein
VSGTILASAALGRVCAVHDDSHSVSGGSPEREATDLRARDPECAAWCGVLEGLEPTIAHDLRGPLNTLTLHVELLRRAADNLGGEQAAERVQRSIQALDREVGRLTTRIDGLLRLIGAPQEPPVASTLQALLDECDQHLRTAARHRNVDLRLELQADGPVRQREVLRRALLLLLFAELNRSESGDRLVASCRLDPRGDDAVLELRSTAAARREGRAPAELVVAESLIEGCGGSLSWGDDPEGLVLRVRFPVDVSC